jgi:hypothetical protein
MAKLSDLVNASTNFQAYDQNLTDFVGTFTLPTSDGTDGQALITRGNGDIQFGAAVSEGGSGGASAGTAYAFSILFG